MYEEIRHFYNLFLTPFVKDYKLRYSSSLLYYFVVYYSTKEIGLKYHSGRRSIIVPGMRSCGD